MRVLLADLVGVPGVALGAPVDDATLAAVYAIRPRDGTWVRANFATSLDGGITGPDGRSGSVNSAADHVVFELLRALSDVVVVGAGTLRSEGYTALSVENRWQTIRSDHGLAEPLPLVGVSNSGQVPPRLRDARRGTVLLATHTGSPGLAEAREVLGDEQVLVCGDDAVDDRRLVAMLAERGWDRILTEGGPHLASSMIAAGVLAEVCLSVTPVVVGGDGPRMTTGLATPTGYVPHLLVEEDGTLMGRWFRSEPR
ncbi:MAG: dihydrofolate reductase family protein [Lapillicoccus sp.]